MTSSSPGANWLWVHLPPQLTVDQCADVFPDVDAKPYRGSGRREVFAPVHSLYRRISLAVFGGCGPPAQSTGAATHPRNCSATWAEVRRRDACIDARSKETPVAT